LHDDDVHTDEPPYTHNVCSTSWQAALVAAGSVCAAVDDVVSGRHRTAFCAVRPPGHHAGPRGIVTCANDSDGTHGFCLLNNVAIGAAYARALYGRAPLSYAAAVDHTADGFYSAPPVPVAEAGAAAASGDAPPATNGGAEKPAAAAAAAAATTGGLPVIRRIAIFDFDVHHGNGTEAVVRNLYPSEVVETVTLPFVRGAFSMMSYRPWLDEGDGDDLLFVSSHGYGKRDPAQVGTAPWFYPGSGAPAGWDAGLVDAFRGGAGGAAAAAAASAATAAAAAAASAATAAAAAASSAPAAGATAPQPALTAHGTASTVTLQPSPVPEVLLERHIAQPHIINVGLPAGLPPRVWRRIMTADVLPRLAAFKPDLIFVSAGFDAHVKDTINCGYLSLREEEYEWVTHQLVKIANTYAAGRIVSVLEGGYRVQGRIVSAFGRSVAAHVRALSSGSTETWDTATEHVRTWVTAWVG